MIASETVPTIERQCPRESNTSPRYADARSRFLTAANRVAASSRNGRQVQIASHRHPDRVGIDGEELAMDVVRIGPSDAAAMLVITSAVHGIEGYCGSGCQTALLGDEPLLARAHEKGIALLLIHAVNPYGFSHWHRVNEDNVDMNRNFLDFDEPLPPMPGYATLHPWLLPADWPPTAAVAQALADYRKEHGEQAYRLALTAGQSQFGDGLFHSGTRPTWSNQTLRQVVRRQGAGARTIGWIDLHSGMGPTGHGEKIYAGRPDPDHLQRARSWWGLDVLSPFANGSVSQPVRGTTALLIHDECPDAEVTMIGLEFGTVPFDDMIDAVRADQWLSLHPEAPENLKEQIKATLLAAFYVDTDAWRGAVAAQARVAVLQALLGLESALEKSQKRQSRKRLIKTS